ncbi:hypothetical protein [Sciscionella marina]|uniref:hypothetical protein n=1 Tax=Sciscionella marina TaxID=508770 RepID=UPI00036D282E|nr:hypothetical protein [Sciscionella marina]
MRLLLRSDAHRYREDGWEIAASPDTPGREQWQWDLCLIPAHAARTEPKPAIERHTVSFGEHGGTVCELRLDSDPNRVTAKTEMLIAGEPSQINRDPHELTVLVVGQGSARLEGRHVLDTFDAIVLEGDDPLVLAIERAEQRPTSLCLVRIRSAATQPISWVP